VQVGAKLENYFLWFVIFFNDLLRYETLWQGF